MPPERFDRRAGPRLLEPPPTTDPAFAARPRLLALRGALVRAVKRLRASRWNEPAVFFFDPNRQAELEAARPSAPDHFQAITDLIAFEMPTLVRHIEVRQVARAIDGLKAAALELAPRCSAANDLADLLAVPDDDVFLVLSPQDRTGFRLHVRGAATVAQFQGLLAGGVGASGAQLFAPAALRPDGTLPTGLVGCGHWFWPAQPLHAVPRIGGERVVLLGPAVVRHAPEADVRFPGLVAQGEVVQTLNPFQVAEALARLIGRPVPVAVPTDAPAVARAA